MISHIDKKKENDDVNISVSVYSKDCRKLDFVIWDPSKQHVRNLMIYFDRNNVFEGLYAFKFSKRSEMEKKHQGWDYFDLKMEFGRQGCDFVQNDNMSYEPDFKGPKWRFIINRNIKAGKYKGTGAYLCQSYPNYLMIPSNIDSKTLLKAIKFRSKNRFPIMTYYWQNPEILRGFATLWRSAQCCVYF